jgi:hypothetical protein
VYRQEFLPGSWLCEASAVSKASVRLRNEADEWDAPRAPSSCQVSGPRRIDSAIVAGSNSRSRAGV